MTYVNKKVNGVDVPLTKDEIDALNARDRAFVVPLNIIPVSDFIQRWLPAEYLALMRGRAQAITAGNITLVQLWDAAMALDAVDLNAPKAQQFKSAIVAAGILTQQRADIIFS